VRTETTTADATSCVAIATGISAWFIAVTATATTAAWCAVSTAARCAATAIATASTSVTTVVITSTATWAGASAATSTATAAGASAANGERRQAFLQPRGSPSHGTRAFSLRGLWRGFVLIGHETLAERCFVKQVVRRNVRQHGKDRLL